MYTKQPEEPCTTTCGFVAERNRYFTGKYMAARDFQNEQEYFLSRHWLHNRLFHGQGIVCGLEVVPHKDPACADSWVVVCPGIAIDCCGRELVLKKKTPVKIWEPSDEGENEGPEPDESVGQYPSGAAQTAQSGYGEADDETGQDDESGPFLLYLRYTEEMIEYVPALYAEDHCDPNHQEANRIREIACLEVRSWEEQEEKDEEPCCRDDCADPVPGPVGVCLEPECPEDQMVPLAIIRPRATSGGFIIDEDAIDTTIQHQLPLPTDFLTHIVKLNWTHGGEITLSELRDPVEDGGLGGRLEVWFDRKLWTAEPESNEYSPGEESHKRDAIGVNEFTLVVQYGGVQRDIEFLPFDPEHPPSVEDDCRAVFTVDPDYLRGRSTIVDNTVYVTLKCDFILDCHNNPVDGDHLKGQLPSGNGIAGGVFESWFRVVPDRSGYREEG